MSADSGRSWLRIDRSASVLAGVVAVVFLTFTPHVPPWVWAPLWAGSGLTAILAVRLWRAAGRANPRGTVAGRMHDMVMFSQSGAALFTIWAALFAVVLATLRRPLPVPWAWAVAPLMTTAAIEFWGLAVLFRVAAAIREGRRER